MDEFIHAIYTLVIFTAHVGCIVFGIQALVVGSQTYDVPCQNEIGVWMIVHGSLAVFYISFLLSSRLSNEAMVYCAHLVNLADFGWVCYGMFIVYTTTPCNQSQFDVFKIMVLFMFYADITMFVLMLIFLCVFVWVFSA